MTTDQRGVPATLWATPDGAWPPPPVQSRTALLPVGELTPENAERLFTRMLETEAHIEHALLYGLPGQAQAGIDAYARVAPSSGNMASSGREFIALQSRRVKKLTAASIASAVTEFLDGEWADRCTRFYYATSSSLRDANLDAAVREARTTLAEHNIEFEPWGTEEIAERLRDQPRLVDDFFGRAWVTAFCGDERAAELARRISPERARSARAALGDLYRAAFSAHGASSTALGTHSRGLDYLILDTEPVPEDLPVRMASKETEETASTAPSEPLDEYTGSSRIVRQRRRRPPPRETFRSEDAAGPRTPVDRWAESARLRLLVGAPGSGKSSFLMFAAADILAAEPQSVALQRAHGGDLPLWLPFAFLCRHLDGSTTNSVATAIRAWVTQQGDPTVWDVTQPALDDERAILLIDGVDEWKDAASAEYALGLIESFVSHRHIGAILTARPYAVDRLNWVQPWTKSMLAPLTHDQQVDLVTRVLSESDTLNSEEGLSSPHAEPFLAELSQIAALRSLLRTPLFLGLLAKTWRGEALPPQRFRLFSALIQLLVDKHPQMRRRASSAAGSEFSNADMLTVLRGVAYTSRIDGGSAIRARQEMAQRFREELRRDDGLAYPAADAARVASAVLSQAEDEYGLLVPQGVGMVGFLHRVLLDQLAGEHLATLPPDVQKSVLTERAGDPTWRDVLIASLAEQVNAHSNTSLLIELSEHADVDPVDRYELIADAIAADVAINTQKQLQWVAEMIDRVDVHADTAHRTTLITSLVSMTKRAALRPRLLETFTRWLNAAHPEPVSALWMLRDSAVAEEGVLPSLLWGLRHEDETVQTNAAHAIANRYAGDTTVGAVLEDCVRDGANAVDQAFALLSLGTGWPDWPQRAALVDWARAQITPELRICALHLLNMSSGGSFDHLTDSEKRWFGGFLRHEMLRPQQHWKDLAMPFVQFVVSDEPSAATFVLDTLSTNGRTGGDRSIAWLLACTTFSGDGGIKDWVADELEHPDRHGLILHNLALVPERWRKDPAFVRSAKSTMKESSSSPFTHNTVVLSAWLPDEEALEALLASLDSWRPSRVVRELLRRFGDRAEVRAVFEERLRGPFERAAPLATFALEVLGCIEGFSILVALLRSAAEEDDQEAHVVVAMAVADAWTQFVRTPEDPDSIAIMREYDEDELVTRCLAVGTGHLTWHAGPIITAWPTHEAVVAFALRSLQHPGFVSSGVYDPVAPAVVQAYGARLDTSADLMMNAVFDQLAYLPPHLREVLVDALTRSDLTPVALRELLAKWNEDPDAWVQRIALTGLIRRAERYRISPNAEHSQIEEDTGYLRTQVGVELCGYGPLHEERRQTAWVAMLMLKAFELHDDSQETRGEPTRPGVRLWHLFGDVDRELVDLLNENWDEVYAHFGDDLFALLSASNARDVPENPRANVLGYLSSSSVSNPLVDHLIGVEAADNGEFRKSVEYLLWSHRRGRRDLDLFADCLAAYADSSRSIRGETSEIYDLLVDSESWHIPIGTLRETLTEQLESNVTPALRALFCELFPTDERSVQMFTELEEWFRLDHPVRERREWIDTLVVAVRASPANVLPIIVDRASRQLMFRDAAQLLPLLTRPLLRRLRLDPEAGSALRSGIQNPSSIDAASTSMWAPPTILGGSSRDHVADIQRSFLLAAVLHHAGLLDDATASIARDVLASNGDVVVLDPFSGKEFPAHRALSWLRRSSQA